MELKIGSLLEQNKFNKSQPADMALMEREAMFELSKELQHELDVTLGELKDLVEHLNDTYEKQVPDNRAVGHIMGILNHHHQLIEWLDRNAADMARKMTELERPRI